MYCFEGMTEIKQQLDQKLELKIVSSKSIYLAQILSTDAEIVAEARLILINDLAVYDRVFTHDHYQRKGLASILIKELEKIALAKGINKNFLVATEEGKMLYEKLGWKLYSHYTTIFISC